VLRRLALEEFVIVEKAALEFGPGLNALTGETGAGKSILIDAIGLLRGGRAGADWIRRGASRLAVEGELDLSGSPEGIEAAARLEVPLEEGALLLVRREVGSDGRSRCFAGGRQVLVSQLRELTAGSLWIVGQGEQRALADPVEQEWILDRFGDCGELRARWRERREAFLEAGVRLAELRRRREEFARESDWLRAQTEEIRAAEVAPGERERLRERLQRLRGRETELALVDELEARLFREEGSVLDHLETLQHRLAHLDDPRWEELRAAVAALRDQARELRARLPGLDPDLDADPAAVE